MMMLSLAGYLVLLLDDIGRVCNTDEVTLQKWRLEIDCMGFQILLISSVMNMVVD